MALTGGATAADGLAAKASAVLGADLVAVGVEVLLSLRGNVHEVAAFVFFGHGGGVAMLLDGGLGLKLEILGLFVHCEFFELVCRNFTRMCGLDQSTRLVGDVKWEVTSL